MTFVQRRPNVFDVGPTLYKWHTNVLCLLGRHTVLNRINRTRRKSKYLCEKSRHSRSFAVRIRVQIPRAINLRTGVFKTICKGKHHGTRRGYGSCQGACLKNVSPSGFCQSPWPTGDVRALHSITQTPCPRAGPTWLRFWREIR